MTNKFISVLLIAIGLVTLAMSCSQSYTLDVLVDMPYHHQPIKCYLLDESDAIILDQIKSTNMVKISNALSAATDTLRLLYRDYMFNDAIYAKNKTNMEILLKNLPVDYCTNLITEIFKIQKFGNVWQFFIKITNNGPELINGLYLTLKFNREKLVNSALLVVRVPPYQSITTDRISVDLSNNQTLGYYLSSYPGGLSKLPDDIICTIDSVKSDFMAFTGEKATILKTQKRNVEEIGLTIDEFPTLRSQFIQEKYANPVNRILENQINIFYKPRSAISSSDTIRFSEIKKGRYHLIAYINLADTVQWHQTIFLESDYLVELNDRNLNPFFLRITEDMFSYRPFQTDIPVEIK